MRISIKGILLWLLLFPVFNPAVASDVLWFNKEIVPVPDPVWNDRSKNKDYDWENYSIPLGNGSLGLSVMSSASVERLIFNEKTLWFGGPNTEKGAAYYWNVNKQACKYLPEIRKAFADGQNEKADRLTKAHFNGLATYSPWGEKPFRFGNYTVAGEFRIKTGLDVKDVRDFKRGLSLDSAYAYTEFECKGCRYSRKSFVSYPGNIAAVHLETTCPEGQDAVFEYLPNPHLQGRIVAAGKDEILFSARLDNNDMEFAMRIKAVADNGEVAVNDEGKLVVSGASEIMFIVTADTDYKINFDPDFDDPETYVGERPLKTTAKWLDKAARKSFSVLMEEHCKDYVSLYKRVELELNPQKNPEDPEMLPTDERLERYRKGEADYALETLYFNFGRYLLIASSRPGSLPANLQGIWHNDVDGPWRVDYHNNINIQMNYWPACPLDLSECEMPYIDYIRSLVEPGRRTARAYYDADGWTASISGNIFGFTSPLSSSLMTWNLIPAAGPWLAIDVWTYYDYTRDMHFLKTVGYDIIRESARFAVDYMWRKPDGHYAAVPSTSPEHGPVDKGATFVHAVIRELLADAVKAAELLGKDEEERRGWQEVLDHIEPYKIGRYGQLMEWSEDVDDPADDHRHVNHLFGLHPGSTISPVTTPELAEASRVVLNHRGDGATGWSMGWKLNQWARLHDGDRAYVLYGNLLKNGTACNLWDTHPPFQIDGNFGGTAGIVEMLVQSHTGFIHLLPALPSAWGNGKFTGIRTRGNFTVDLYWKSGKLDKAVIRSNSGGRCRVRYASMTAELDTEAGKAYTLKEEGGKLMVL